MGVGLFVQALLLPLRMPGFTELTQLSVLAMPMMLIATIVDTNPFIF